MFVDYEFITERMVFYSLYLQNHHYATHYCWIFVKLPKLFLKEHITRYFHIFYYFQISYPCILDCKKNYQEFHTLNAFLVLKSSNNVVEQSWKVFTYTQHAIFYNFSFKTRYE